MMVQHSARLHEKTIQRMALSSEEITFKAYRRNGGRSRNNTSRVRATTPAEEVMATARALIGTNGYTRTITKSSTEVWVV